MWFTETPWPPVLICAALAVVLMAAWSANRRPTYLASVICLLAAACVILAVERFIVTDSERIEASVYGITSAFQRRELDETLDFISPTAPPEIKQWVTAAMQACEVHDDLRIRHLQIAMKSQNSRGIADFHANATVSVSGHGELGWRASRWELTWQREADQWKVIRVRPLDVQSGREIPHPLTSLR